MPHLRVAEVAVHYRETGRGAPVVLLHGGGSSGAQWKRVCDLLADRYRMITVDHYGHGGTDRWKGPQTARTHDAEAALVSEVIAHIGEPAHVVGHSYGGGVALRLALADPGKLRSLVLVEPQVLSILKHGGESGLFSDYREFAMSFIRDANAGDSEGAWARFLEGNGAPVPWQNLTPEVRSRFLAMTDSLISAWYANVNHDTTPDQCRSLNIPATLLRGETTRQIYRRITELLSEVLPLAHLQVLPGAGHMSPLTHPEAVANALAAHLHRN